MLENFPQKEYLDRNYVQLFVKSMILPPLIELDQETLQMRILRNSSFRINDIVRKIRFSRDNLSKHRSISKFLEDLQTFPLQFQWLKQLNVSCQVFAETVELMHCALVRQQTWNCEVTFETRCIIMGLIRHFIPVQLCLCQVQALLLTPQQVPLSDKHVCSNLCCIAKLLPWKYFVSVYCPALKRIADPHLKNPSGFARTIDANAKRCIEYHNLGIGRLLDSAEKSVGDINELQHLVIEYYANTVENHISLYNEVETSFTQHVRKKISEVY